MVRRTRLEPILFHVLFPSAFFTRSQPRLQAHVDLGAMSFLLEHFQLQGAMCLGASAARYGEVGKYFKHRCIGKEGGREGEREGPLVQTCG